MQGFGWTRKMTKQKKKKEEEQHFSIRRTTWKIATVATIWLELKCARVFKEAKPEYVNAECFIRKSGTKSLVMLALMRLQMNCYSVLVLAACACAYNQTTSHSAKRFQIDINFRIGFLHIGIPWANPFIFFFCCCCCCSCVLSHLFSAVHKSLLFTLFLCMPF